MPSGESARDAHDPAYADDMVGEVEVPGIDRVGNGEAEYLMLVKTRPNRQHPVSRELRRRGFRFVGPTICYAFMQAVGMVNDHLVACFRHRQVGR